MSLDEEPHPPTLGTLQAIGRQHAAADGKTGMAYVVAKLDALNSQYCWNPALCNKEKTNWAQVNRHIWRIRALYHGGDCFLACWPGAVPHQALYAKTAISTDRLARTHPKLVRKNRGMGHSLSAYRPPKADPVNYNPDEWDEKLWAAVLEGDDGD